MYKFIIIDIKDIFFFVFYKFSPSLHSFNILVIKFIMHAIYINISFFLKKQIGILNHAIFFSVFF